jgi:phosphoglycolate phosphatase-like HAD superfamily hydrolase
MSDEIIYTKNDLVNLIQTKSTFVGIDSDGCVFDTMEVKQKICFHPIILSHWHLEPIEKYVRESAEFVNLYSNNRGSNRFISLINSIDLIRNRPEVIASGVKLPEFTELRKFIDSGVALGNPALATAVAETGNEELKDALEWSIAVNKLIEDTVKNLPPFKWVIESLIKIKANSDAIVISQTPCEALVREWAENDMDQYVELIAGQEHGTKTEHIKLATSGKYDADKILMIGDALGDKLAAKANNALFYAINPTHEEESWERFYKEAYDKFLDGTYAGDYEQMIINEFETLLPETPSWQ